MASVNRCCLLGNLGADPETRYMPNGDQVTNIRLATTESWKDKNSGERKEVTEWHRVVFYRKLAEVAGQYLKKGSQVYLEGRIRTRKWTDKDGAERYTTEIEATELQMLGRREGSGEGAGNGGQQQRPAPQQRPAQGGGGNGAPAPAMAGDPFADDIPFGAMTWECDPVLRKAARVKAIRC